MAWKDSILLKGVWNGLELTPRRKGDQSTSYPYYEIKLFSLSVGYGKQGSHRTTRWKELCKIRLKVRGIFLWGHVLQRNSEGFGKRECGKEASVLRVEWV